MHHSWTSEPRLRVLTAVVTRLPSPRVPEPVSYHVKLRSSPGMRPVGLDHIAVSLFLVSALEVADTEADLPAIVKVAGIELPDTRSATNTGRYSNSSSQRPRTGLSGKQSPVFWTPPFAASPQAIIAGVMAEMERGEEVACPRSTPHVSLVVQPSIRRAERQLWWNPSSAWLGPQEPMWGFALPSAGTCLCHFRFRFQDNGPMSTGIVVLASGSSVSSRSVEMLSRRSGVAAEQPKQ